MPITTIQPPTGGIVRQTSFQSASDSPFTAYDLNNFWPIDAKTGRAVLATRPPLQSIGSPSSPSPPITNMIVPVNGVRSGFPFESVVIAVSDGDGDADGKLYFFDGTDWIAATGAQAEAVDDDRSVYGASILSDTYIPVVGAKPIRFRYTTGAAATLVETAGTCPTDNRMAVVWQGALCLAGNTADPNVVYVSRIGDPLDYDFTVASSDIGGAFFTSGEDEGRISGPVTALIPQTAETLIVSATTGLIAMRGHPRQGGVFEPVGGNFYALGQGAWAKVPGDILFFMSKQGLVRLDPQAGSIPIPVQKDKIPMELLGLTYSLTDPTISMSYCSRWHGLIISVRNNSEDQAWWYDLNGGGFYRMQFESYPWVMYEHPPFITDNTSGVLHGRYDGVHRFDIFGTDETVHSSAVWGPVRISPDDHSRSRLNRTRVLFGRDTPSSNVSGRFKISTGVDGQDAISKMLRGEHQYETPLSTFSGANDACYPLLAGGAAAFGITMEAGDVSIEQITADVVPSGTSPFLRGTQLSVTGTPTSVFTTTAFDATLWAGYSEATPINPSETLTDHTHFIDLSELPATWWAQVSSSGGDVRATDSSNTQIPLDLVHFDKVNSTGFATVKLTQTTSATPVRLWVGRVGMAQPIPSDTFGQHNAYDSNWYGFYPDGGGEDRTSFANDLTHTQSTPGDSAGVIGALSTDYVAVDSSNNYGVASSPGITGTPATLVSAGKYTIAQGGFEFICGVYDQPGASNPLKLEADGTNSPDFFAFTRAITGTDAVVSGNSGIAVNEWHHYCGVISGDSERIAYVNGGNKVTDTSTTAAGTLNEFIVGKGSRSGIPSNSFDGFLSLTQFHNVARSDGWISYQASMMDQSVFWGAGWGAFVPVNVPGVEPDPPTSACPSGIVSVTETGTWTGYDELTADPVPANTESLTTLLDFSHWIDLSLMSATWWSSVAADGSDIRATDTNNVFLPLDLVEFDQVGNTGFAVVRGHSDTADGITVRLWAGNASAVTVPACASYGQYRAYDQYTQGFWPSGGGTDRTAWERDLTTSGGATVGGISGPAGAVATRYDGVDDFGSVDTTPASGTSATDGPPVTLFTALRVNSPDIFHVAQPIGLTNDVANYYSLNQAASIHPFIATIHAAVDQWLSTQLLGVIGSWTPVTVGFGLGTDGNVIGRIIASTTVDSFSGTHTGLLTKLSGLNRFNVGGFRLPDGTSQLHFDGDLAFSSLHSVFRPEAWSLYNRLMLTQSTFWTTPAWTASSSSLPQP